MMTKKFKNGLLILLIFILPYVSYFSFDTPVYPVSFFQYTFLQIEQKPSIKKIGHWLYLSKSKNDVIAYLDNKNWEYVESDGTALTFRDAITNKEITIFLTKVTPHFVIIDSVDKLP